MKQSQTALKLILSLGIGFASMGVSAQSMKVNLTGAQEVPPVTTSASGVCAISNYSPNIFFFKSIKGSEIINHFIFKFMCIERENTFFTGIAHIVHGNIS